MNSVGISDSDNSIVSNLIQSYIRRKNKNSFIFIDVWTILFIISLTTLIVFSIKAGTDLVLAGIIVATVCSAVAEMGKSSQTYGLKV